MNYKICLLILTSAIGLSLIHAFDYLNWGLEIIPIIFAMPFIYGYGKLNKISTLLLWFIALHGIVLAIGGHYTYANVTLGKWFIDLGIFERNNYDKIGHFLQGFVPAMILNEIYIRKNIGNNYRGIIITGIILACGGISALYEIIEWQAAVMLGNGADEFLGTQGYVWDTQSDMLMAIIGSIVMVSLFLNIHKKSIKKEMA